MALALAIGCAPIAGEGDLDVEAAAAAAAVDRAPAASRLAPAGCSEAATPEPVATPAPTLEPVAETPATCSKKPAPSLTGTSLAASLP